MAIGTNPELSRGGVATLLEMFGPLRLLVPSNVGETADILRDHYSAAEFSTIDSGQPERGCVIMCGALQLKVSVDRAVSLNGFKNIFCNVDEKSIGSVISIGLGSHLAGGEKAPAIVKAMLSAAAGIGQITKAFAVMWMPASTVSGFDYFTRVAADYDQAGAFPVLALVNFQKDDDGNIRSTGLDWLSGQELCVAPTDLDEAELMRRVVRIAHDVAVNGPVTSDIELAGIDSNETVELRPSGALLGVRILSVAPR